MADKMFEVMAKGKDGVTPPNSTCTTYPLLQARIWAKSKADAELKFSIVYEGEYSEMFTKYTKEIEPTSDELADIVLEGVE